MKGISQPTEVYEVLGEGLARTRLEVAAAVGITPLVGREQEVRLLLDRWDQVQEGSGHVVCLRGEGGIGKSRLVGVLKERVAEDSDGWLMEYQCSPYHQNSALYPVIDQFERELLQFGRDDSSDEKLSKLEGFLVEYDFALEEAVPLFASVFAISLDDRYPPPPLTREQRKQKTFEALVTILRTRAHQQPLLFVVEDVQWADPSTLELLTLVIDQVPTSRILAVLVFRPHFQPPWTTRSYITEASLNQLPHEHTALLVEQIAGGKALPSELLEEVVSKTDGVPLFVEELTKTLLGSGLLELRGDRYELTGPLPPFSIPETLRDSLMARLDRLAGVKEVLQLAASLGREFPYELLRAVSPLDEEALQDSLSQLVDGEFLYVQGVPPRARYIFKHNLIQEAAYQSLLKSAQQRHHHMIASVLEEGLSATVRTEPELLAHHYTEAGLTSDAIRYWQKAGERALERCANREAIVHLTKGLDLLEALPDAPERREQELTLHITLGPALMAAKGWAAPEVEQTYARALELCDELGENAPQLFAVLLGLWNFYHVRGELQTARDLGERLLTLAQSAGDSELLIEAHASLGDTLFHSGELASSLAHFEEGIALYDAQERRSLASLHGDDAGVTCRCMSACGLWLLGKPDKALARSQEALSLAEVLAHPWILATAHVFAAAIHQFRREHEQMHEQAAAAIALSTEQGFPNCLAIGMIHRGSALVVQATDEDGVAQLLEGIEAWRATGARVAGAVFLCMLAAAYLHTGQRREGLDVVEEALTLIEGMTVQDSEAEVFRLEGELLLLQDGDQGGTAIEAQAEERFRRPLAIARDMDGKSWELRTAISLSRLWQRQGRKDEARELLDEIYTWFDEGFDTPDLQEAKALLHELS